MITNVKLVATKPRTFTFRINGIPACAVVSNDNAEIYCNDKHITLHNVLPSWTPTSLQSPKLPRPANIIIIQAQ